MSSLVLSGDTSGTVSLSVPTVAGSNTISVQAATASMSVNTLATAVASTSGTSIDFTGLPAWVKRITVMFNGVSTSGTSLIQIQIGSGSVTTSGYACSYSTIGSAAAAGSTATSGFIVTYSVAAANAYSGLAILALVSSNSWLETSTLTLPTAGNHFSAGSIALAGALDRVRITTVNGTDTFDAGSVNILYEG